MRVASGAINDTRPLVAFLYALMLDEITPCRIERLASGIDTSVSEFWFLNGWRAGYAQDLADLVGSGSPPLRRHRRVGRGRPGARRAPGRSRRGVGPS